MKKFDYILFDFDGTIFNTSPGVFKSFDKVVEYYNLDIDKSLYNKMIGPPLYESFSNILHLPESEIRNAIDVYRKEYAKGRMFDCTVYDGVIDLIQSLRNAGKKVYVATSKPEIYAREILKKNNLTELFDFIGGSDTEEKSRVNKIDVIKYVLESQHLTDKKDKVLMIGDRHYDVNGAHLAGLECMGILWGFGTREEFTECKADYICSSTSEVKVLLCS